MLLRQLHELLDVWHQSEDSEYLQIYCLNVFQIEHILLVEFYQAFLYISLNMQERYTHVHHILEHLVNFAVRPHPSFYANAFSSI